MKFERITLENFRQYYGRQRLEFAKDKQRKVTVIHGVNGAGKTSLFLAMNWCLYGSEYVSNVGEVISKEVVSRVATSEYVDMSVELSFLHDGERYIVKRSRRGVKMIDGSVQSNSSDEFAIIRMHGDGQAEKIGNPVGTINAILPANIRTYFLFDGEKIDDFAKPESTKQVKEAIYQVFKLITLERAQRHLEGAATDYRKELKNTSSSKELRDLLDKNEKARTDLATNESRKTELLAERDSVNRKISDIDQRLREIQDTKALQQERDRIGYDLKQRRTELDNAISRIRDMATSAYFTIATIAIDKAISVLEIKREKGEIPSNIRQQFVRDLIAQMQCICGRPFEEDSLEHRRLISLLETTLPDSLGDDVMEISAVLRTFEERSIKQRANITHQMKQRATLVELIKELEAKADDVRRQLKDLPLEEVNNLERQRQEFEADVQSYTMEIGRLIERIEGLNKNIAQLEKDINKARKNEDKEKHLSTKLYLAQQAADAIKETYQAYADDMRIKIEAKTKDIFQKLVWKESYFRDISLDEDFNLEVIDQYGRPARPELSAGERQVLSLSFITAMSRISEEEAPLVMDTPFGRLSAQHRSNITQQLPELADQVILLVTDEELHGQARSNLEPYIGNEYRLAFDTRANFTKIEEC